MSIRIEIVEEYPQKVFNDLVKRNLESNGFIRSWKYFSEGDSFFEQKGRKIRIGAFDGSKLIGLSWGQAISKNRFLMAISLVEKKYRNQGIYSKMLKIMLQETQEFDEIDSYHHILNNQILRLKLKNNFYIIGIQNCIKTGTGVKLRYFNNNKLLDFMKFRTGLIENPILKEPKEKINQA
jgi:hypothetical protein